MDSRRMLVIRRVLFGKRSPMVPTLTAAALASSMLLAGATGADAAMKMNTIAAAGSLGPAGRSVEAAAIVACTAGQRVRIELTLTQGSAWSPAALAGAVGRGVGGDDCTGDTASYPILVTARTPTGFQPGEAQACAEAATPAVWSTPGRGAGPTRCN